MSGSYGLGPTQLDFVHTFLCASVVGRRTTFERFNYMGIYQVQKDWHEDRIVHIAIYISNTQIKRRPTCSQDCQEYVFQEREMTLFSSLISFVDQPDQGKFK